MLCVAVSRSGWLLLLPSVASLPRALSCARRSYRPLHVTVEDSPGSGAFLLRELVEAGVTGLERLGAALWLLGVRGRTQWYLLWSLMVYLSIFPLFSFVSS